MTRPNRRELRRQVFWQKELNKELQRYVDLWLIARTDVSLLIEQFGELSLDLKTRLTNLSNLLGNYEEYCLADCKGEYFCRLPKGHSGMHDDEGVRWEQSITQS